MPLNNNGRHAMLTGGLGNTITHISGHSGIPDDTGSGELSGGSYARVAVSWAAAASGQRANSGSLTMEIPASSTLAFYGLWSASSGGTFYGSLPVNGTKKGFGTAGTDDVITSNGHGLSDGARVFVLNVYAESLPTGLTEGTLYYVRDAAANTFKLAATAGGAAVDITSVGELAWFDAVPEAFASAGQASIAAGGLVLDATVL